MQVEITTHLLEAKRMIHTSCDVPKPLLSIKDVHQGCGIESRTERHSNQAEEVIPFNYFLVSL